MLNFIIRKGNEYKHLKKKKRPAPPKLLTRSLQSIESCMGAREYVVRAGIITGEYQYLPVPFFIR